MNCRTEYVLDQNINAWSPVYLYLSLFTGLKFRINITFIKSISGVVLKLMKRKKQDKKSIALDLYKFKLLSIKIN